MAKSDALKRVADRKVSPREVWKSPGNIPGWSKGQEREWHEDQLWRMGRGEEVGRPKSEKPAVLSTKLPGRFQRAAQELRMKGQKKKLQREAKTWYKATEGKQKPTIPLSKVIRGKSTKTA